MNVLFTWAEEYLKLVDKLWTQENFEEGWNVLDTILYEEPGFAKAHNHAGWYAQHHLKDNKRAKVHYEYALLFDPALSWTYVNYGELLVQELDENRMKSLLKDGLKYDSVDRSNLYTNVARLMEMKENYSEAATYFKVGMKYVTNEYTLQVIKRNRKRVRSKKRMFGAWYSKLI